MLVNTSKTRHNECGKRDEKKTSAELITQICSESHLVNGNNEIVFFSSYSIEEINYYFNGNC